VKLFCLIEQVLIGDDRMGIIERTYGKTFGTLLWLVNPIKKVFKETLCEVHVFINNHAFEILRNDGYEEAYDFYQKYIQCINEGVVWADQDFKSREHFYNPYTHRGLYGCRSSMQRFGKYYRNALVHWDCGDYEKAMFYLGAAAHLIQDATIPQHGSIHLLRSHRKYEQWIYKVHDDFKHYSVKSGGIYLENPYEYIEKNAKKTLWAYRRYRNIKKPEQRYYRIANVTFPLAQKSTAGLLLCFYRTVKS